jgi:hypothetical protein
LFSDEFKEGFVKVEKIVIDELEIIEESVSNNNFWGGNCGSLCLGLYCGSLCVGLGCY